MFVMVENLCPVVLEETVPEWLILGQYLHKLGRLQGCADMYVLCSMFVLVDALTR